MKFCSWSRHEVLLAGIAASALPTFAGIARMHLSGRYTDEQLLALDRFTLPRVFLYTADGTLVAREHWPAPLARVKHDAGDAFCCVSDTPVPPGHDGPPPDCQVIVYGEDVRSNFTGLQDEAGRPIAYEALPPHRFLLVEYFATWCPPCVIGRKSMEAFFRGPEAQGYAWVSIDMGRLPEVKKRRKA